MTRYYTLSNGLRYIMIPDDCPSFNNQNACFIQYFVKVGGKDEPDQILGISHLLEHLLFSGTRRYSQVLKSLDRLGAQYNAHTTKESTNYHVWVSSRKALEALKILTNMLFETPLTEAKIKKEIPIVRQEMRETYNNPNQLIHEMMSSQIFGSHPLSKSVIGTPETLANISADILQAFYLQYYRPENMVLVIQGKIDPSFKQVLKSIPAERNTLQWSASPISPFKLKPKMTSVRVKYQPMDQTVIGISFPMFGMDSNLKYHALILSILVGGNFSSYLYNLRETYALVYHIHSKLNLMKEGGYFYVKTTTKSDALGQVLNLILDTLARIPEVTEDKMIASQDYIVDHMILNFKDPRSLTDHYGHNLLFLNQIEEPKDYLENFQNVKLSDLQRLQDKLFNFDRVNVTIIGPHHADDRDLQSVLEKYQI